MEEAEGEGWEESEAAELRVPTALLLGTGVEEDTAEAEAAEGAPVRVA